jgi:hypothetical protein
VLHQGPRDSADPRGRSFCPSESNRCAQARAGPMRPPHCRVANGAASPEGSFRGKRQVNRLARRASRTAVVGTTSDVPRVTSAGLKWRESSASKPQARQICDVIGHLSVPGAETGEYDVSSRLTEIGTIAVSVDAATTMPDGKRSLSALTPPLETGTSEPRARTGTQRRSLLQQRAVSTAQRSGAPSPYQPIL